MGVVVELALLHLLLVELHLTLQALLLRHEQSCVVELRLHELVQVHVREGSSHKESLDLLVIIGLLLFVYLLLVLLSLLHLLKVLHQEVRIDLSPLVLSLLHLHLHLQLLLLLLQV